CVTMLSVGLLAAEDAGLDQQLATFADTLASEVKQSGRKKVSVLDFTDLRGKDSDLGLYLADKITVALVKKRKDFSVMDRANLKRILEELKLTQAGLVDPENVKKLGQFSGVDAIVLGKITPLGD